MCVWVEAQKLLEAWTCSRSQAGRWQILYGVLMVLTVRLCCWCAAVQVDGHVPKPH